MILDDIFGLNGLLSQHFPNYEQRIGQVKMAYIVDTAIKSGSCAVVEGSTGIGKSFAYLTPSILSGKKVIVSTSNKSLQDQLSNKDLPSLKEILPISFNWAVLKGKNNYFCHEHFKTNQKEIETYFLNEGMSNKEIGIKLKEIIRWADETEDGDIEYYPNDLPLKVKEMIVCDAKTVHDKESIYAKLCFAKKAREKAKDVQILLVNHTLLALDISLRKETNNKVKILPDTEIIIIDEAHTFEKYAVMAFSDEISWFSLYHLINWSVVIKSLPKGDIITLSEEFKGALQGFLPEKGNKGYYLQKKFPKFDSFETTVSLLQSLIEKVENNKKLIKDELAQTKVKEVVKEAENLIERLYLLGREDENMLRWSEARENERGISIKLRSVPIDISELLKEGLFKNKSVICTSATLAVSNNFDFFNQQLGVPETALNLITESPFNFKKNCLIYVSTGESEKAWEVQQLLSYSKGRAFILFTSYKEMNDMYEKIDTPYPKLIQSNGVSRVQLLEQFKNTPNAVLFATKSFWEGIDVKGEQLSMVIIDKIPFENPSDLIYASKIERIDQKLGKGKHWTRLTIPDACLKLKQGVGRLIRSQTDVGLIALLDPRINFQDYGKTVMNCLPPANRTQKLEKVKTFFERI